MLKTHVHVLCGSLWFGTMLHSPLQDPPATKAVWTRRERSNMPLPSLAVLQWMEQGLCFHTVLCMVIPGSSLIHEASCVFIMGLKSLF